MTRVATALTMVLMVTGAARADSVFDVCKGESKTSVAGTGKMSIAVVYPEGFPATTTPVMRNAVGAVLARAEKAKIVPAVDVEAATRLVNGRKWTDKSDVCGFAPSLVAVLGLKHTNLATANASVTCDDKNACVLAIDLERHGRPTKARWARYVTTLSGPKDQIDTYTKAAAKLVIGKTPDHPTAGLAVSELPPGVVTVRSDVDGALEADRTMEGSSAFAACGPKGRKKHDIRGYWAEWTLSAKGTAYQTMVKPFAGADPADQVAAECLRKALESTQIACPRDGKTIKVKTAICL
jgi:hypothetical protein